MLAYNIVENKFEDNCYVDKKFAFFIFATSYVDPLKDIQIIKDIELNVSQMNQKACWVLFDLLACTGENSERFISIFFNGENFDLKSYYFLEVNKQSPVRKIARNVLLNVSESLDYTILNGFQKKILQQGIFI